MLLTSFSKGCWVSHSFISGDNTLGKVIGMGECTKYGLNRIAVVLSRTYFMMFDNKSRKRDDFKLN